MGSDDAFTAPLYSCIAGLASGLLLRAVRDGIAIKVAAMDYVPVAAVSVPRLLMGRLFVVK